MSDEAPEGFEAEFLGTKVIEMAERVAVAHKVVPGAVARYVFDMDDAKYEVRVSVLEKGE